MPLGSNSNLLWVLLAIKAELRNLGSLRLARARNAYTETTDFSFDFGVKIGRFCLLCSTLLSGNNSHPSVFMENSFQHFHVLVQPCRTDHLHKKLQAMYV